NFLAKMYNRLLIEAGSLIGADELAQFIAILTDFIDFDVPFAFIEKNPDVFLAQFMSLLEENPAGSILDILNHFIAQSMNIAVGTKGTQIVLAVHTTDQYLSGIYGHN